MGVVVKVELRDDLNQVVARMIRGKVERIAREVAAEAAANAPAAKVWITAADERVRPSHVDAEGQTIPENLRFKLRKQRYVGGTGRGSGRRAVHYSGVAVLTSGYDLARKPRDPALPRDQKDRCRCISVRIPNAIARKVHAEPAVIEGSRVTARIVVQFQRIAESEFGTSGDPGTHFLGRAVNTVAARLRGASARRT
ncbi:hypothetical protein [Microbispora sp. NPDC049125]|uniref:hypothetical protein n=1 Tax=Microbispora sp. NPDC049125 TaxID=3154929 RepID=UPI003465EFCC